MYNVQLIHGFHCFEFIELTLFMESNGLFPNISLAYFIPFLDDVNSRGGGLRDTYTLEVEVFGSSIRIVCRDVDYARCNACVTL